MSQLPKDIIILHRYGDPSHFLAIADQVKVYLVCDPIPLLWQALKRKIGLRALFARLWRILYGYVGHPRARVYVYGFAPESAYFIPLCLIWWRSGRRVLFSSFSDSIETLSPGSQRRMRANLSFAKRFFDGAAAVSLSAQRTLTPHLPTALVEHTIDVGAYRRQETRHGLVFLGRIAPYKNVEWIIEAADTAGLALDIVGPNETDSAILDDAVGSVCYLGPQSKSWIKKNLGGYRALILASDTREPFGVVLLEAMAAGVLPVVSRTHGTETIFRDWPDYPLLFHTEDGLAGLVAVLSRLRTLSTEDEAQLLERLTRMAQDYRPEARAKHWQQVLV